ncbi:MAG: alpha/beta hydrolase [Pseudomonadota bacterium]
MTDQTILATAETLEPPASASIEDVYITAQDGVRLHARVYGARQTNLLPVLCLPGLSRTTRDFDDIALRLAAKGRRVVALDYRGRGQSGHATDWRSYSLLVERADVLDICASLGIERAAIIGSSRGGLIAMAIAPARPGLIAGLTLVDVGPQVEPRGIARIKSFIGQTETPSTWSEAAALLKRSQSTLFDGFTDADWDLMAQQIYADRNGRPERDFDPNLPRILDEIDFTKPLATMWKEFDALSGMPLLLIHGLNSDVLTNETIAEMRKRRPDIAYLTVPGEGHVPLLRDGPVNDAIIAFVEGL